MEGIAFIAGAAVAAALCSLVERIQWWLKDRKESLKVTPEEDDGKV